MNTPKFSIIVPVYNSEKYIEKCIDSLTNQSYDNIEIVLINDGSKDSSLDICQKKAASDDRIVVIDKINGGVSAARNDGIDKATGDYIICCDSDDWAQPDLCESYMNALEKFGDGYMFICGFFNTNTFTSTVPTKTYIVSDSEEYSKVPLSEILRLDKMWFMKMPWNKLFSREIIIKNNLRFDESISLGEDYLFVLDYIECVKNDFIVINKPLYNYIQDNPNSLWFLNRENIFEITKIQKDKVKQTLDACGIFEENEKAYYDDFLHSIIACFYSICDLKNKDNKKKKIDLIIKIANDPICESVLEYAAKAQTLTGISAAIKNKDAKAIYAVSRKQCIKERIYCALKSKGFIK